MNAERLLGQYERITEAPDAIARVRQFILDLAVRGKLVAGVPNDEPANALLGRIDKERSRLVMTREIRKPKELLAVEAYELPFGVPAGWSTPPLDNVSPRSLADGDWIETKDQSEDGGVRLIQLADIGVGEFLNKSARFVTEETEVRLSCTRLAVGDVLIARLPNPIGRACIFPDIGQPAITAVDVAILRLDANISGEFIVLAMNAPPLREQIEAYGKGATRFRVSTGHLKTIRIPLPPLAEQHRIVAKVDELMALCNRLEAARAEREAARDRLAAASLGRLNAPDPETFQADARFALDELSALTTRADQIKHLRQAILNLAVSGALSVQDPAEGTGAKLLSDLRAARKNWEAAGRIRKERDVSTDEQVGGNLLLPGNWCWSRLTDLGQTQTGTSPTSANSDLFGDFIPFIKPSDLDGSDINYEGFGLSELGIGHSRMVQDPSILMVCIGATLGKVNKTSRAVCFNQQINSLTPFLAGLTDYIAIALKSSTFQSAAWSKAGTGTLPIISKGKWELLTIPLPPLAEQQRIVAKVDELMALCDRLEASLAIGDDTRRRLLDALLHEALAPALDEAA
jgi:type I restriction enzyme, S subunit